MDTSERTMLDEVALRNAIARFRRINAATKKRAAVPEVGIFWIDDSGKMFVASVSLRDAVDYGEFRIFEGSHLDSWSKAIRAVPKWKHLEYEEVPRGRVVYRRDPKQPEFIVYMPKVILKHKGKVIARFNLPAGYTLFNTSDEHYQTAGMGLLGL